MCATCELAVRQENYEAYRRRFELLHLGGRVPLSIAVSQGWFVANTRSEPLRLFMEPAVEC